MSSKNSKNTKAIANNFNSNPVPNPAPNPTSNPVPNPAPKSTDVNNSKNINKLITSNLHNPYKKTILSTPIMLSPDQMDNKMYIHLKSNLKNKLENKCYENYGYIDKIYNIEEISDGVIEPEDSSCSAKMDVKFSCNLFLPIVGKEIICKIKKMNKALIMGVNGPIEAVVTTDKINKDNFFPDVNRNIRVKGTSEVVVPDMYIRVLIISKLYSNYDKNILVIGFLQDIATQKEIDEYFEKNNNNEQLEIENMLEN